ncbi:hypothetical protein [Rhizohabitans arisaemae]|uniref:hypothetical protein n=1 Tax=Rhizohabitans arisaemae TaxID=2720610 RepID=UPI0024B2194D|nr:hypothetical protein [Rhizohabitans arisaemae]
MSLLPDWPEPRSATPWCDTLTGLPKAGRPADKSPENVVAEVLSAILLGSDRRRPER